jgi:hypothetical protein
LSSHEPAFRHDACTVAITSLDQSIAFVWAWFELKNKIPWKKGKQKCIIK